MAKASSIAELRGKLESRFGLALVAEVVSIDGGTFPVIRPADLESGVGFGIVIARTHRQVEASFRADNFAGPLLRKMKDAEEQAKHTFSLIRKEIAASGAKVYVAVNGIECQGELLDGGDEWRRLELDVTQRLPSGTAAADAVAATTLEVASACLSMAVCLLPVEPISDEMAQPGLPEGARVRIQVNRYERSPANRAACLAHYGASCTACGFDFRVFYGSLGEGYAEVHHKVPVSQLGPDYRIDPTKDLVPLCANCHAMVHRRSPPLEIEQLRALIEASKTNYR
jgi:5-methylcytosine-specific restriction protein A